MVLPSRVMLVEDEPISQNLVRTILEGLEIELVGCYDNAHDIREALPHHPCDLILMDINIKGPEDGIQCARSLLEHYDIPIIFISAYNDSETLAEVMELSPYGFITKPFSAKDIEVAMGIGFKRFCVDQAAASEVPPSPTRIAITDTLLFDTETHMLYDQQAWVHLNKKQTKLIEMLVASRNRVVAYETLIQTIWPDGQVASSSLRTLVYSLRHLLPGLPIESHSKMGYLLRTVSDSEPL